MEQKRKRRSSTRSDKGQPASQRGRSEDAPKESGAKPSNKPDVRADAGPSAPSSEAEVPSQRTVVTKPMSWMIDPAGISTVPT